MTDVMAWYGAACQTVQDLVALGRVELLRVLREDVGVTDPAFDRMATVEVAEEMVGIGVRGYRLQLGPWPEEFIGA